MSAGQNRRRTRTGARAAVGVPELPMDVALGGRRRMRRDRQVKQAVHEHTSPNTYALRRRRMQ
jgi:hypothetical protein